MSSKGRQWLIAGVGLVLVGVAGGEDAARRAIERHYRQAVQDRQQIDRRFRTVLATHEQITSDLYKEQRRSQELSDALKIARAQLEQTVGQLAEESRNVRELHGRLASVQQQVDQLQGELSLTMDQRQTSGELQASKPIELERIVVSDAKAPALQGRVLSVHPDWNFVVVDLGWNAVKVGETVSIFRNDRLLAKARVERVQERVCAATVLPEWQMSEIKINDLAKVL